MEQGSTEWHEWRLGGIGASEISAIRGTCPYNTKHDVWLVKTKRSKGFEGNSFTQHGQETEGAARARYELITMEDMPPALATHPTYSICRASLDGLRADGKLILEIKCPSGLQTLEAAKAGIVPGHYKAQVQYQMAVAGADVCHFFVWHAATQQHALVEEKADVQMQGELIAAALDFWAKHVLTDIPPELTDRDVKIIPVDDAQIAPLCALIKDGKDALTKSQLDAMKADAVKLAGHPKMKCGDVQISTVMRAGKFSYHKLTISKSEAS